MHLFFFYILSAPAKHIWVCLYTTRVFYCATKIHKPGKIEKTAMCPCCHGAVCTEPQSGLCYAAQTAELFFKQRIEAPEAVLTALRMYMLFDKSVKAKGRNNRTIEQNILRALAPVISVVLACKMVIPWCPQTEEGLNPSPTADKFLMECIQDRIKGCATVKDGVLSCKEKVREVFKICERTFLRDVDYRGIIIKTGALLELREYICEVLGGHKLPEDSVFAGVMHNVDHMICMFSLQQNM